MVRPGHLACDIDGGCVKAGRELDAKVAEFVMGFKVRLGKELKGVDLPEHLEQYFIPIQDNNTGTPYEQWEYLPPYSISIEAAWTLVEHLVKNGMFSLSIGRDSKWYCSINGYLGTYEQDGADTAPLAIALASLKAVEK